MSQSKYLIAISSQAGNPKNPKTWSGTPSNIAKAIESLGVEVIGIDSSIKRSSRLDWYVYKGHRFLHRILGLGNFDYERGRLARTDSAKVLEAQSQASGCTKVLHTSTLDLPLPKLDPRVDHYLFCDTTWNLWSQYVTNIDRYTSKMLRLAEQLERESYAQIKHFFPISEYVRENLINHYQVGHDRITVVGTGRGKIEPYMGHKDYENGHILFVAKDRFEDKGGTLLIEGFKKAQKKKPSLKLVVVGQEQDKNLIGYVPNVTITGFIPWEELQTLFNTAALFAMPAVNEPWGLVYIEALCCRIPVLGLNRNSLPEITCRGKFGFLADEPTPEYVADKILQAFSDPTKLREMGTVGQQYCLDKYSWKQVATKIASIMLGNQSFSFQPEE